nr:MAG TPA: hypothetical protein [Bacteriophage sp.]
MLQLAEYAGARVVVIVHSERGARRPHHLYITIIGLK